MGKEPCLSHPATSPLYEWRETSYRDQRFELVLVAFKQFIGHGQPQWTEIEIGKRCVRYADAALAEMEKEPDAENDDAK